MCGYCENEDGTCEIPRTNKPSLCKARWRTHNNGIILQGGDVEEESACLLNVCEEEVVDQEEKLIDWYICAGF